MYKVLVCLILLYEFGSGANILAIFPFTAKSHFAMFEPLLIELQKRHHNLTVVSHYPRLSKEVNYTDISLVGATTSLHANMSLTDYQTFSGLFSNLYLLNKQIDDYETIVRLSSVQNLIHSNQSFDLIITEIFNTDLFLGFVDIFKCPYIAMSPSPLMPWAFQRANIDISPFIQPHIFSNRKFPMSILSNILNSLEWVFSLIYYKYFMNYKSQKLANRYFSKDVNLEDIAQEVSYVLVNTHMSVHNLGMTSSKLIEVGGMHIQPVKMLPKELGRFMDEADNGVIVFSMGSMLRGETLPSKYLKIFLNVFSKLKQRILWKWESSEPPTTAYENIKFMKWLPQRDVLGHRNVRLFIYHGGLLGISEGVYSGVPILGLPQFGDMGHNIAALGDAGLSLDLTSLDEQILTKSINALLSDSKYKQEAVKLSELYRDRPVPPLDLAVFWTEYALKHEDFHTKNKKILKGSHSNITIILTLICISLAVFLIFIFILLCNKLNFKRNKTLKIL